MFLFFFLSTLAVASAVTYNGECPEVKLLENVNVTAYLGTWYQVFVFPEPTELCAQYEYYLDGELLKINGSYLSDGYKETVYEDIHLPKTDEYGNRLFNPKENRAIMTDNDIVATDYTGYSIQFKCLYNETEKTHSYKSIVSLRTPTADDAVKAKINDFFKTWTFETSNNLELDLSKFTHVQFSEENCKPKFGMEIEIQMVRKD